MKYSRLLEIPAPPTTRAQQSRKAWKIVGVAFATAALMLWTTGKAQAVATVGPDTVESWVQTELDTTYSTISVSGTHIVTLTGTTATQAQIVAALTAAIKERTSLASMTQLTPAQVGSWVATIIADRGVAADTGALVGAAIAGLKASSQTVYTADYLAAIGVSVSQTLATLIPVNTPANLTLLQTDLKSMVVDKLLDKTVIPVLSGSNSPTMQDARLYMAAQVIGAASTVTLSGTYSGTALPAASIAAVANEIVTKVAEVPAATVAAVVTTQILNSVNLANYSNDKNKIVTALLAVLPASSLQSAFHAVITGSAAMNTLTLSGSAYSETADNATAIFLALNAATNKYAIIKGITAEILSSGTLNGTSLTGTAAVNYLITSATTGAIRNNIAPGVAAGASLADPAHVTDYINTAISSETFKTLKSVLNAQNVLITTTTSYVATATNKQDVIKTVVQFLAPTDPQVSGSSALSTAVTNFINTYVTVTSSTTITGLPFYSVADKTTLAKTIIAAALTGTNTDSHLSAIADIVNNPQFATVLSGSVQVVTGTNGKPASSNWIPASTSTQQAFARTLITALGTTDIQALQTFANATVTSGTVWTGGSTPNDALNYAIAIAGTGNTTSASAPTRAALAYGIAAANPTLSGSLATSLGSQFVAPVIATNYSNAAIVGASIIKGAASVNNTAAISNVVTSLEALIDGTASLLTTPASGGPVPAADRAALAKTLLANLDPSLTGTIAALAVANSQLDAAALRNTVAVTLIKAYPKTTSVLSQILSNTYPTVLSLSNQIDYMQKVIAVADATTKPMVAGTSAAIMMSSTTGLTYSTVFTTGTAGGGSIVGSFQTLADAQLAQIAAAFALNDAAHVSDIVSASLKTGATAATASAVAAAVTFALAPSGTSYAVTAADAAAVGSKAVTAANLGLIGNKVVLSYGNTALGVTNDLAGRIPTVTGTALSGTSALQTNVTTRIQDLGTLAGAESINQTDSTALQNIIAATTTGTVSGLRTVNLATVLASGTLGATTNLVNYAIKATTAATTVNAIPFFKTFMTYEQTTLGLTNLANVSSFVARVINANTGQGNYLAQATQMFGTGVAGVTTLGLSGSLSSLVTVNAGKSNTAAGLALTTPNLSGTIAYQFANSVVATGTTVSALNAAVTAKISVATTVAGAGLSTALQSWNVAQSVASLLSDSDKATLANGMVAKVATILAGPTLNERLGLLVSSITAIMPNVTNQDLLAIGKVVAYAINAKASAAYDILGSVAATAGSWTSTQLTQLKGAVFSFLTASNQNSALVQNQLSQAIADLTGHHFFFWGNGDLTLPETQIN